MGRYKIITIILFTCILSQYSQAQSNELLFETLPSGITGLNTRVFDLIHDNRGFAWFGTDAGLWQYDGYSIIRVQTKEEEISQILGTTAVEALAIRNNRTLWIGTEEGLILLDLNSWDMERPEEFRGIRIRTMLLAGDTLVWLGTSHGLFSFNPETSHAINYNQVNAGLSQNMVRALYQDLDGNLWVGTEDKFNVLPSGKDRFIVYDLKKSYRPGIPNNMILDIQPYSPGNDSILLVGTQTGLCLMNRFNKSLVTYNLTNCDLTNEVVKCIYPMNQSRVLLGTDLGLNALNLLTGEVEQYYHNPFNQNSITDNEIWKIRSDPNSDLWFATSNGVSRLKISEKLFEYLAVIFEEQGQTFGTRVADVQATEEGMLWIGTSNGLISSMQAPGSYTTSYDKFEKDALSIDNINTLTTDNWGRVWIGSMAGINIWDPKEGKLHIPPMDEYSTFRKSSTYISAILEGYDDFFWISTWGGGLYKTNRLDNTLEDIRIRYVADMNGWVVKGAQYLFSIDGNRIKRFNVNTEKVEQLDIFREYVGNEMFTSMCFARNGILWLGTRNKLLSYNVEDDQVQVIPIPFGEEFIITGLIEDREGILWGCSSNTLFRYELVQHGFEFFHIPVRIPIKKFSPSPFNLSPDGKIMVSGYNGLLRFDPDKVGNSSPEKNVTLTRLRINGELVHPSVPVGKNMILTSPLSMTPRLHLSYIHRNFTLEFSSFSSRGNEMQQYAFMLQGFDKDWRITKPGSNSAEYNNLPPGRYTFVVKANSLDPAVPLTSIPLIVDRQAWLSLPLLATYCMLVLFLAGMFLYLNRIRVKDRVRLSTIEQEKERVELVNTAKTKFFVNMSHEMVSSLGLVIDPLKGILSQKDIKGNLKSSLKSILKNAQFLKIYIDQLLDFRKIELGKTEARLDMSLDLVHFCKQVLNISRNKALSRGISLKFQSEFSELWIDSDQEKLNSILQNLVSNAIQYTPSGGDIVVRLRSSGPKELVLEVRDNGTGIPEEYQQKVFERFFQLDNYQGTNRGMGIGLTIVKEFTELLKGKIALSSTPGRGTLVQVFLPNLKGHPVANDGPMQTKVYLDRDDIQKIRGKQQVLQDNKEKLIQVLVVDEHFELYEYIHGNLNKGYSVIWSSDAEQAMHLLDESSPGVIISEYQLRGMDGITFCRKLRSKVKTKGIPFILLTTRTEAISEEKVRDAGVDIFLAKPADLSVLEANISNLVKKQKLTEDFVSRRLMINESAGDPLSKKDVLLEKVVAYIHEHMTNTHISADEISLAVGISHSSLYRKIKDLTGLSINEFIRYVRLQKAEKLLLEKGLSVAEVMYQVGFTNHSYFSKCFKMQYKHTPREYMSN